MNERIEAQERQLIRRFIGSEMTESGMIYLQYPEGYDQGVAARNNRIFADVVPREFPRVTLAAACILVDTGLAQAMSHVYYCARSELGRSHGS